MKKIFTLFSLLMLTVVAMAADLKTGVTYKGTWGDIENAYTPVEGEMTVTRTDKGLKFEVKINGLNNYAFPAYVIDYELEVSDAGHFDDGNYTIGETTGDATVEGEKVSNMYWQKIKGDVTNESIDLTISYLGVNMTELLNVTFKGTAVETTGINTVNTADNSTITEIYTLGGARVNSLQKGINIVRLANGKTVKVVK